MPYKVFKSGSQWCVHKSVDGDKGKKIGCHDSESSAKKQMRALYANESKEVSMPEDIVQVEQEENETKERLEKGYVPWGVTSFTDLEDAREAAEAADHTYDLLTDYTGIVSNILNSSEIEDKGGAVKKVTKELESKLSSPAKEKEQEDNGLFVTAKEFDNWGERIINGIKELFTTDKETEDKDEHGDFMLWKEADGTMRWLTTYSNKFRDEDRPPEIISEISHERFERLVDEKQVSMPELWLWHVPEWKFGVADWVAYDTEGFALASGTIDEGKEAIAEWIGKQRDVAVSHGMPIDSIVRDPDDSTIIVGHVTREISPLPYSAAANKRTDFLILSNDIQQEEVMMISSDKKTKLQEVWKGAPPSLLEQLESSNAGKAKEALDEGVDFKETEAEATAEATTEEQETDTSEATTEPADQAETETQSEAEESEAQASDGDDVQPEYPTRTEVVEAVTPMAKQIAALEETVKVLVDVVKELTSDDEAKIAKAVSEAPPASIAAMMAREMSTIGDETAKVKGSESLAKRKPKEAPAAAITGIEFIDNILQKEQ